MNEKTCTRCGIEKPLESFNKGERYRDGYRTWCRDCERDYRRERREYRKTLAIDVHDTAVCSSCGQEKPASEFGVNPMAPNGLRSYCHDCNRDYQREWARSKREASPEFRERQRKSWARYRQKIKADPERSKQRAEARRKYLKQWYAENRQTPIFQEKRKAYYRRVRDQGDYKLSRRLASGAFRARKHGARNDGISRDQWREVVERFGHSCVYCGEPSATLEVDHVVPLSRGGAHSIENVVPCCRSCNSKKGKRTPEEAAMQIEARYDVRSDKAA